MFEHHSEPVASRSSFARRMAASCGIALAMISAALAIGVLGYRWIAGLA